MAPKKIKVDLNVVAPVTVPPDNGKYADTALLID